MYKCVSVCIYVCIYVCTIYECATVEGVFLDTKANSKQYVSITEHF